MNIAIFGTLAFGDKQSFQQYLSMHEIEHSLIANSVVTLTKNTVPEYPLSEMSNDKDWLMNHDQIHRSINATLGIDAPVDLQDYDLQNEQDFYEWTAQHNAEHDRLSSLLGL